MIVKNRDYKSFFHGKILEKFKNDELATTLEIDRTSQEFLFQRISEISEKIIIEETEILLKNANFQYFNLKTQYKNLENLLKEKSQELRSNEVKTRELELELRETQEKNTVILEKIEVSEKKFKEIGRNFDIRLRNRESQLLEIIDMNNNEKVNLKQILSEQEEKSKNNQRFFEEMIKEVNYLNLFLENDLEISQNSCLEEDPQHIIKKLRENFGFWRIKYENKIEELEKKQHEKGFLQEKEQNNLKNIAEKLKIQLEKKENEEKEEFLREIAKINEKNQMLVEKIKIIRTNYSENDASKNEILLKLKEKTAFLENNLQVSQDLRKRENRENNSKIRRILEKFRCFIKEIKHEMDFLKADFQRNKEINPMLLQFKDLFNKKLKEIQDKNLYKQHFLEENIEKIKEFYTENSENLIKKQKTESEQIFSEFLKEKENLLRKNENLERDLGLLKRKEANKLKEINNFEEKLLGIRSEIEDLQNVHQIEKEQIYQEFKAKIKEKELFREKTHNSEKELNILKKKVVGMEKMIEKLAEINSFDQTANLEKKIKLLKRNLEEFEEISLRNSTHEGFSFEKCRENKEKWGLDSGKTSKIKRFSLGEAENSRKQKFFF